ncbi:TonB-dependent receptor [Limibacter armeniacum]|uniref:TonB-dependent receptor n=1 Tax=Limibacter armeniacum TaxID=466084 RepID=UPI002FE5C3C3
MIIHRNRLLPIFFIIFFTVTIVSANAQDKDSVRILQEVTVITERLPERVSFKNTYLEKAILQENLTATLGELLTLKTPIFVKNYGAGGTATPSFRGTGASHTQLYWNDINLNSPMLGQVDLSMFPVAFTDEVQVNYGASSLSQGTGGLGGAIQLNSRVAWEEKYYAMFSQSANSLHNYITNGSISLGNSKIHSTTKVFLKDAANRFDFVNPLQPDNPVWSNKHSKQRQYGLLEELTAKISSSQTVGVKVWYQEDERALPPSMDKENEYASLGNNVLRVLGEWQMKAPSKELSFRTAYINDSRNYEKEINNDDPPKLLTSDSEAQTLQSVGKAKFKLSEKWYLQGSGRFNLDKINSGNYLDFATGERIIRAQETVDLSTSVEWLPSSRLSMSLLFRQQWIDGETKPFLPSLGADYLIWEKENRSLSVKGNISRNFHAPSLNDRYWGAAGNPDLLPEEGWMSEAGLSYDNNNHEHWQYKYEITAFASLIDNWIVWQPRGSSGNLWQPINMRQVYSRGIEQVLSATYQKTNWKLDAFASYSFVKSENQLPYTDLDESVGRQLIYTPVGSFQGYLRFRYQKTTIRFEQLGYGKRLIQTDGSSWLPPYYLSNLIAGYTFDIRQHRLTAEARIDNLFGYHYQSIARKAMPTRTYQLTLTYHLNP